MRMMTGMRMLAGIAAVAAVAACSESATGPGSGAAVLEAQDVLVITSAWSGYTAPRQVVVADAQAWAAEWQTIWANHTQPPALPAIDFATSVIVIAAMGQRPTTGYSITIAEVRAANGSLQVDVQERSPGASCVTGQALTSPVHIVQVPRHSTTASFNVTRTTFGC